jgi:dipeptidase E
MRLLLFSNSTNSGEDYLNYTLPYIKEFVSTQDLHALFIPFAAVSLDYEAFFQMVVVKIKEIGIPLISIHRSNNPITSIENANLFIVGGGNSFSLLKKMQDLNLLELIRKKVQSGTPYIGWSAGSNLACPSIKTTNDMPIVQPASFEALNLIPFQINPHYTDLTIKGHGGESREIRINEFLIVNPDIWVVGLREGTLLQLTDNQLCLKGKDSCRIFRSGTQPKEIRPVDDLNFLMQ